MILALHPAARREHLDRIDYLDRQRPGLGERYLDAFWETALLALASPHAGHPLSGRFRALRLRRFSMRLIYAADGARISVVAISHDRQRPFYWRQRHFEAPR